MSSTTRKFLMGLFAIAGICLLAPGAFAQTTGEAAAAGPNWVAITSGFAMALASAACAYAQAKVSSAASEGMARNPGAAGVIQNMLILSLVLIESMALYTFAIIFVKVK
jgi:F-type H+-transporting ATPase subunit c